MIRRVKLAVLLWFLTLAAALAPGVTAQAATVTPQQLYGLQVERPYVHTDVGGRRWVYAKASTSNTGYRTMRAVVTQKYGGQWHVVGNQPPVSGSGYLEAIGTVLCTGSRTNYSFGTVGQVQYGNQWYSVYSGEITIPC